MIAAKGLRLNGRGVAAADVDNDGRMEIAINTIGGKLVLLHPTGPSGHWLDVQLSRFAPGAVVTAVLPDGQRLRASCRPAAATSRRRTRASTSASARRPRSGRSSCATRGGRRACAGTSPSNRVVRSRPRCPCVAAAHGCEARARELHARTAARPVGRADLERRGGRRAPAGGASEPVQARDLFDLATTVSQAWHATSGQQARETAISYAAYRLLLWRASYGANLDRAVRAAQRAAPRALPLARFHAHVRGSAAARRQPHRRRRDRRRPATTARTSRSTTPTRATRRRTSRWSSAPPARRSTTRRSGSRSRSRQKAAQGGGSVPADVQTFDDSQWGGVRTFAAARRRRRAAARRPVERRVQQAALAAIRATSQARRPAGRRPIAARLEPLAACCPPGPAPPRGSNATSGSISP